MLRMRRLAADAAATAGPLRCMARLRDFLARLRAACPRLPILVVSAPLGPLEAQQPDRVAQKDAWRAAQRDAVEQARAGGDANIAFLDGRTLWPDGGEEYTVDGVHPTDLGFYFMARGLLPVLLPYLTEE